MNTKYFFGIRHLLFNGGEQDIRLTIAVSNAGGMDSLPCATLTGEQIVDDLKIITQVTAQPFNLNFFCHNALTPNA